jgi:hypothetical protein
MDHSISLVGYGTEDGQDVWYGARPILTLVHPC